MAKGGVKRGSPGADDEKNQNPLANVDLSEEDAQKLAKTQRELGRVELAMGWCPPASDSTPYN
jgi:template-activating factor I